MWRQDDVRLKAFSTSVGENVLSSPRRFVFLPKSSRVSDAHRNRRSQTTSRLALVVHRSSAGSVKTTWK